MFVVSSSRFRPAMGALRVSALRRQNIVDKIFGMGASSTYGGRGGWLSEHIAKEIPAAKELRYPFYAAAMESKEKKEWRQKWIFRIFGFFVPTVYMIWWETSRMEKLQYMEDQRSKFRGDTAFYGKCWGYQTDYIVECGLQTGDVFFIDYDKYGLHSYQGFWKFFTNMALGNSFNEMGVILKRNSQTYIVFPRSGGLVLERYCDVLAHHRIASVCGRRLACSDKDRKSLKKMLEEDIERGCRVNNVFFRFFEYVKFLRLPDMAEFNTGGQPFSPLPVDQEFVRSLDVSHKRCDMNQAISDLKDYKKPFEQKLTEKPDDEEAKREISRADNDIKILNKNLQELPDDGVDPLTAEETLCCRDDGDYIAKTFARVGLMPSVVRNHHIRIDVWEKMNRLAGRPDEGEIGTELSPPFFVRESDHGMYANRKWSVITVPKARLENTRAAQEAFSGTDDFGATATSIADSFGN